MGRRRRPRRTAERAMGLPHSERKSGIGSHRNSSSIGGIALNPARGIRWGLVNQFVGRQTIIDRPRVHRK
jgi:hypothetical protein